MLGERVRMSVHHKEDARARIANDTKDAANVQLASKYNYTILSCCARRVTVAFYSNWMIAIMPDAHWRQQRRRQRRQRNAWKIARKHTHIPLCHPASSSEKVHTHTHIRENMNVHGRKMQSLVYNDGERLCASFRPAATAILGI